MPFASDVTFESPLTPKITGTTPLLEFLIGLFPAIQGMTVKQS